nr:hypothetical protein [Tanacetum cinerariifolium]
MKERCKQPGERLIRVKHWMLVWLTKKAVGRNLESRSSRNDVDADDADIKPIYDKEPMAEKSIDKRALHKREYDTRVNERKMQTTGGKVDTSKALDASLVNKESSGTESGKQEFKE